MRRELLRFIDKSLGWPIAGLMVAYDRAFRTLIVRNPAGTGALQAPKNILVIKMVGLGDTVLMLTPVSHLRRQFPEARITALVTPLSSGVVAGQPSIDEVILFDALSLRKSFPGFLGLVRRLRSRRFDCVIDFEQHFLMTSVLSYLTGSARRIGFHYDNGLRGKLFTDSVALDPGCHMVDAYMDLLEPLGIAQGRIATLSSIHIPAEDEAKVASWLAAHGISSGDLLVGIHAGSGPRSPHRRWDKQNFAEIILRMRETFGARTVLTGTVQERGLIDEIVSLVGDTAALNGSGEFEAKQVAALAKRCRLFISNDTGAMHIAAAVGTPTIGLFGPQAPCRYAPVGSRNAVVYKRQPCSPCIEIHKGEVRDCGTPVCMQRISIEDVWTEILRYDLGKPGRRASNT
jgi:ADP-heptose:LPS heptosyltransferase